MQIFRSWERVPHRPQMKLVVLTCWWSSEVTNWISWRTTPRKWLTRRNNSVERRTSSWRSTAIKNGISCKWFQTHKFSFSGARRRSSQFNFYRRGRMGKFDHSLSHSTTTTTERWLFVLVPGEKWKQVEARTFSFK